MIVRDDRYLEFVSNKMDIDDLDMAEYKNTHHLNYFGDDSDYFLCVAFEDGYMFIYFAWHEGTHKARRGLWKTVMELVRLSENHVYYTTTQENLHSNHNRHIRDDLYQLIV